MSRDTGLFLAFEGIDGCGKSTLIRMIAEDYFERERGEKVFITQEPFDTPIGKLIRKYLSEGFDGEVTDQTANDVLTCLFAADRKLHMEVIKKKVEEGYIVLCDRYVYSSLAYQKNYQYTLDVNQDYYLADNIIYIDADIETCLKRVKSRSNDTEIFEKREELERIKHNYDKKIIPYLPPLKAIKINGNTNLTEMYKELTKKLELI